MEDIYHFVAYGAVGIVVLVVIWLGVKAVFFTGPDPKVAKQVEERLEQDRAREAFRIYNQRHNPKATPAEVDAAFDAIQREAKSRKK